ncbi:MAG: hypothetical protein IT210_08630 [Armatimonadetes bacterium]|nr:hypothetical protein [Armatimonadota bacterium]
MKRWSLCLALIWLIGIPLFARLGEPPGAVGRKILFGLESIREWEVEGPLWRQSFLPPGGSAALRRQISVACSTGEPNYPAGWPRINHILGGDASDWSLRNILELRVDTRTNRKSLPQEPVGLLLYTPDRENQHHRPLKELAIGRWASIRLPLSRIPHRREVRLLSPNPTIATETAWTSISTGSP